jgi:hypothetical protein
MYQSLAPFMNFDGQDWDYPVDPFIVQFTPGNELGWGTLFGGNGLGGFWEYECIYSIVDRNDAIYVAGNHAKPTTFTTSYFPLDEANGTPYFSEVHAGNTQGFVASFCPEFSVGTIDQNPWNTPLLSVSPIGNRGFQVFGLPQGTTTVDVYDLLGKRVHSMQLTTAEGGVTEILCPSLASGGYVLRFPTVGESVLTMIPGP